MTCGHTAPSAAWSDEFEAVLCDPCYGRALEALQRNREKTVTTNTRQHFEEVRAAREHVWPGHTN